MNITSSLKQFFFALHSRNYRLFFAGQAISLCGTWMQTMALSWLAFTLTKSPAVMGFVWFLIQAPSLLISPMAGMLADKYNRCKLLIIIQSGFLIQAAILSTLTLSNHISIALLLVLSGLQGLITAYDFPIRQSMIPELLNKPDDLPNAIALNSFVVNSARIVGPAIAGIIVAKYGEGLCFLANSLSYIAVIIGLLLMKLPPHKRPAPTVTENRRKFLLSGLQYVWHRFHIRGVFGLLFITSFIGTSYMTLLPMFVNNDLHSNASGMGFLMMTTGIGAVVSALFLARSSGTSIKGLERQLGITVVLVGIAFVGLAFCKSLQTAYWVMPLIGFCLSFQFSGCNTFVQAVTKQTVRGRVMGLYALIWNGISPFGNLLYGFVAEYVGSAWTIRLGGIVMLISGIGYMLIVKRISCSAWGKPKNKKQPT